MKCPWREASTLILTALKGTHGKGTWNYAVLTLKRSLKSSFMPNSYVFPGGVTDLTDTDRNWLDLFSDFEINYNSTQMSGPVGSILKNQEGEIPKLLSLKIAAIRETFEETGILLCTSKENKREKSSEEWASIYEFEDLNLWRSKVQKDASEFLNLCLHFNCCPDVNNLHLWSNWLTPITEAKRFDTAFFFASLKEYFIAAPDKREIVESLWCTPVELLELFKNQSIFLPLPQFYEIRRLIQFKDIFTLKSFAKSRSEEGCETWMSLWRKTSDGFVIILPGDDAYTVTDFISPIQYPEVKMTSHEFRLQSKVLHRIEISNKRGPEIIINGYEASMGHVLPLSD